MTDSRNEWTIAKDRLVSGIRDLGFRLSNTIMLYAAGGMVERNMNRGLYLLMYFISGLAGGCLSVWQQMIINEEVSHEVFTYIRLAFGNDVPWRRFICDGSKICY